MNRLFFVTGCILLLLIHSVYAQTPIYDKVELGAQYVNQSFYSLKEGEKANVTNTSWDLQFATAQRSASIRINDAKQISLYVLANPDTSNWLQIDTTGMIELFNSDTSWQYGAFNNLGSRQHPDYGCLYYVSTGQLRGHRLFVIRLNNGQYKKIWIRSLDFYEYTILIGNLDNTDEQIIKLDKSNYSSKNFVYYDLENMEVKNLEPAGEDWDLVFRKYYAMDSISFLPFNRVTGVLANLHVQTAEARGVRVDTLLSDAGYTYSSHINVIGFDWKHYDYNNMVYEIDDDVAYFVKTPQGEVYKLVFTGFSGSSSGRIEFMKTKIESGASSVSEKEHVALSSITVYPNPAVSEAHVLVSLNDASDIQLCIFNMDGKLILEKNFYATAGLHNYRIEATNMKQGFYFIKVSDGKQTLIQKLLIAG